MTNSITRRRLLVTTVFGGVGVAAGLAGCDDAAVQPRASESPEERPEPSTGAETGAKTLLVYFSRAGENYYNGVRRNLDVGNSEVLARMIDDLIECDVYSIEAERPYPTSYDLTVDRNSREQDAGARPGIANPLPDVGAYDTVLIGSPVWNVRAPMIMSTFIEGVLLEGKSLLPFVTYAVSGMGSVEDDYRRSIRDARVGEGLAVRGEEVAGAGPDLEQWLRGHQLIG